MSKIDTHIQIWVAAVDPTLTHDGLISPGLGDTVSSMSLSSVDIFEMFRRETVSSIPFGCNDCSDVL